MYAWLFHDYTEFYYPSVKKYVFSKEKNLFVHEFNCKSLFYKHM